MLSSIAAVALIASGLIQGPPPDVRDPQDVSVDEALFMPPPGGGEPRTMFVVKGDRLERPKTSPKHNWMFEWLVSGYGRMTTGPNDNYNLRLRVFSQERKAENDRAPFVARMVLRLWDYNLQKLRYDHAREYNNQIVDFYLCWGGEAGGEHLFDEDFEGDRPRKVNTVYIYQIQTFTDPVEMAREVAHEYGHATLPPVGGFVKPEDWGNGYLGEKLYLRYLRDEMKANRLGPADAMGADAVALGKWVAVHVDPLVKKAAAEPPSEPLLRSKGQKGIDAYTGLALYAESILPPRAFGRALRLGGSNNAWDLPKGIVLAATEVEDLELKVPAIAAGQPIWVPLGRGTLTGGKVLKRAGDWAQVQPSGATMRVKNPPPKDL